MIDAAHHRHLAAERMAAYVKARGSVNLMEAQGPRRAAVVQKAAIPGQTTASAEALADLVNQSEALVAPSMHAGLFDAIRGETVPGTFFASYGAAITYPGATSVAEGRAIPVTKFETGRRQLRTQKSAAIVVVTNEMVRHSTFIALLERLAPSALGLSTDALFIPQLIAAAASINASGVFIEEIRADLLAALGAINYGAGASLHMGMGVAVARRMSFIVDLDGRPLFPAMTPTGGRMSNLTVHVTEALTDDVVIVDATGILTASGAVEFDIASSGAIEMATDPTNASADGGSPAAPVEATNVSLFQTGSVALRLSREFDWTALRSANATVIRGAGALWGAADTSPPAWSPPA